MRRTWVFVGSLTLAGAVLRFATLDAKGFWIDEWSTSLTLDRGVWDMLTSLPTSQLNPPLYYLLAWPWMRVFGDGEVALRSLPALFGTATIPVAYLAGRELVSHRAGLVTAALVAFNPLLVWYSQEARPYALLVLVSTIALALFGRALREPRLGVLLAWGAASALAMATHFFAGFLFLAEATWLLRAHRRIPELRWGLVAPVAAGVALVPLLLAQYDRHERAWWFNDVSLFSRAREVPGFFLVGFELPWPQALVAAIAAALLTGLGLLFLRRAGPPERRGALVAGSIAVGAVVLPLAVSVVGPDGFLYRNVLAALVPAAVVVAAGFGAAGRAGEAAAAGLCALSVGIVLATGWTPKYQRETWREAAAAIGDVRATKAVVATPNLRGEARALGAYERGTRRVEGGRFRLTEVVVVALPRRPLGSYKNPRIPAARPLRPPAGFQVVERRRSDDVLLVRYRARQPRWVTAPRLLAAALDYEPAAVFVTRSVARAALRADRLPRS